MDLVAIGQGILATLTGGAVLVALIRLAQKAMELRFQERREREERAIAAEAAEAAERLAEAAERVRQYRELLDEMRGELDRLRADASKQEEHRQNAVGLFERLRGELLAEVERCHKDRLDDRDEYRQALEALRDQLAEERAKRRRLAAVVRELRPDGTSGQDD